MVKNEKAQVWIETFIYTLIAFIILGAILSFAKPKIEKMQDKSIIDQSIKMLENVNNIINEIKTTPGNKRELEVGMKKGSLTIDSENDQIVFNIETKYVYSEPGTLYKQGNINIYDKKVGEINKINATLDYQNKYNITWKNEEKLELLSQSSTPYKIFISNLGGNPTNINFEVI